MVFIVYNTEDIGAVWAPSINAALRQIHSESGVVPIIRAPYGGKRTPAEQQQINPGQTISDHVKGRAIDLWNWEQIAASIGFNRMRAILAKWHWLNVQVNGDPFPTEPWHHANQLNMVALLALNVKAIFSPKPKPPEEEDDMKPEFLVWTDTAKKEHYAQTVPGTSFWVEYPTKADYNAVAAAKGVAGARVTEATALAYKQQAAIATG